MFRLTSTQPLPFYFLENEKKADDVYFKLSYVRYWLHLPRSICPPQGLEVGNPPLVFFSQPTKHRKAAIFIFIIFLTRR